MPQARAARLTKRLWTTTSPSPRFGDFMSPELTRSTLAPSLIFLTKTDRISTPILSELWELQLMTTGRGFERTGRGCGRVRGPRGEQIMLEDHPPAARTCASDSPQPVVISCSSNGPPGKFAKPRTRWSVL